MEIGETYRSSEIDHKWSATEEYSRERNTITKIVDINNDKEKLPIMHLVNCDFSLETRIARLEFRQSQQYRTVEKYVTQNYVKYPIYSEWKSKVKTIRKTVKLNNEELENLENNADPLIAIFARQIVSKLGIKELEPSWYKHIFYLDEYNDKLSILISECERYNTSQNNEIMHSNEKIEEYRQIISSNNKSLKKEEKSYSKITTKLDNATTLPKSIWKNILSFGIYCYLRSASRITKIINKQNKVNGQINFYTENIEKCKTNIDTLNANIAFYKDNIDKKEKELDVNRRKMYNEMAKKVRAIKPLPTSVEENKEFTPLKQFSGLTSEKFIGCYVIHNVKNDKYYVGQSKDVPKRIRQHFNGTVPKNIIFAEDYYSTPIDERDSLFEIKVLACATKDELDSTEKQLIEDYDAFRSGYNGTGGNS